MMAGFKSEWTAGIAAIRTLASTLMVIWLLMRLLMLTSRLAPALAIMLAGDHLDGGDRRL